MPPAKKIKTKKPAKKARKATRTTERKTIKDSGAFKTGKKTAVKLKAGQRKAFRSVWSGEGVISNTSEAVNLYNQSRFGEIVKGKVFYSLVEALYLLEKGKLAIYLGRKKLDFDSFMGYAKEKEENFYTRYCVYSNLRERGYIVKTALKFGADFRVYAKGIKPGEDHAVWIVYSVFETRGLTWHEFAAKNRVAHSTRKKLLIGIVDAEGDVTYYEVGWKRP